MKRCLKSSLVLFLFFLITLPVYAKSSVEYYRDQLSDWGVTPDILEHVGGQKVLESSPSFIIKHDEPWLLLKTSQLEFTDGIEKLDYTAYIIICDTQFELDQDISCNYSSVSSDPIHKIEFHNKDGDQLFLANIFQEGRRYLIVPELYFANDTYKESLIKYFYALSQSQKAPYIEDNIVQDRGLLSYTSKALIESLGYIAGIFILATLFRGVLLTLFNEPQQFKEKTIYEDFIKLLNNLLTRISEFLILLFPLTLSVLILALVYVSFNDIGSVSVSYMVSYAKDSVDLKLFKDYVSDNDLVHTGIAGLVLVNAIITFLIISPYIFSNFLRSLRRISRNQLRANSMKYIFSILVTVLFGFASFDRGLHVTMNATIVLTLLLIYFLYLSYTQGIDIAKLFSKKDKYIFIGLLSVLLISGTGYTEFLKNRPQTFRHEDLIGVSNDIVLLPYSKSYGDNILFNEYPANFAFDLYVNRWHMYSPTFTKIHVKPISDLDPSGSFEILAFDSKDYLSKILDNPDLIKYLSSSDESSYIYLQDVNSTDSFEIEMSFDCTKSPKDAKVRYVEYTGSSEDSDGDVLVRFPGCEPYENLNYRVPMRIVGSGTVIVEIKHFLTLPVENIKVFKNGGELTGTFLKDPNHAPVVYLENKGGDTLNVYSFGLSKELTTQKIDGTVNISQYLNDFKVSGNLRNPFLIWSPQQNAVIRNKNIEE